MTNTSEILIWYRIAEINCDIFSYYTNLQKKRVAKAVLNTFKISILGHQTTPNVISLRIQISENSKKAEKSPSALAEDIVRTTRAQIGRSGAFLLQKFKTLGTF